MPFFRRTILRDTVPDPIILRHLVSLNPDFLIFFYILFQISSFAHLKIEVKTLEGGMMVKGQRVDLPLTVFPGKRGRSGQELTNSGLKIPLPVSKPVANGERLGGLSLGFKWFEARYD